MKSFFTEDERARLIDVNRKSQEGILSVFTMRDDMRTDLVEQYQRNTNFGLNRIDATLGDDSRSTTELSNPESREKLLSFLSQWLSLPQIDFMLSADYLISELGLLNKKKERVIERTIAQQIDLAHEKMDLATKITHLIDKFPFMLTGHQLSYVLSSDKEQLITLKPQYELLNRVTLEDISMGKIDFDELDEVGKYYSPFTPTLRTLRDIEGMILPPGQRYFPIVNPNLSTRKSHDFKGIVQLISKENFDCVKTIDPRIFRFGYEGVDIRNFLTSLIMTPKLSGNLIPIVEVFKRADYMETLIVMNRNLLVNYGAMFGNKKLLSGNVSAEEIINPAKVVFGELERYAKSGRLEVKKKDLEEAAQEIASTSFLVAFRGMRHEHDKDFDPNSVPKALNPGLVMVDPVRGSGLLTALLQSLMQQWDTDFAYILKVGPRNIPNGGKYYNANRRFFQMMKENPGSVDITEKYDKAKEISKLTQNKQLKEFIDDVITSMDSMSPSVMQGHTNADIMHYLSARHPSKIILEELNDLAGGNLMLGYAMNNCLTILDLMRYHSNPDAHIHVFWWNGEKVGMSYDIMLQRLAKTNGTPPGKDPLIDSIELSDSFYTQMHATLTTGNGSKLPEGFVTASFVYSYLMTRLQHSDAGIYVLPESNNFQVKEGILKFIKDTKAKPLLEYSGNRVRTDTDFRSMPYWVEKNSVVIDSIVVNEKNELVGKPALEEYASSMPKEAAAHMTRVVNNIVGD